MRNAAIAVKKLKEAGLVITTVESCSGGSLVSALTDIPGASEVLKDSFITYSNEAKIALGVPQEVIDMFTVYSKECAEAMAKAALRRSSAHVAVAVTGSLNRVDPANPGTSEPGTVHVHIRSYAEGYDAPGYWTVKVPEHLSRPKAKEYLVRTILHHLVSWLTLNPLLTLKP